MSRRTQFLSPKTALWGAAALALLLGASVSAQAPIRVQKASRHGPDHAQTAPTYPQECGALLRDMRTNPAKFAENSQKMLAGMRCGAASHNRKKCANVPHDKACGEVVLAPTKTDPKDTTQATVDPKSVVVANLDQPGGIAKACGYVAGSVVGAQTGSPTAAIVAGGLGTYSCDKYLQEAARHNPLVIVYPTAIPTVALTKDGREAVNQAMKDMKVKGAGAVVAAPAIIAVAAYKVGTNVIEQSPFLPVASGAASAATDGAGGVITALKKPTLSNVINAAAAPVAVPAKVTVQVVQQATNVVHDIGKALHF